MPSVQFSLNDLEGLLGRTVPRDVEGLNEILAFVKGDVESLEGDAVSIEVKDSNRPDIWSVEGIARALRYQLGTGRSRQISVAGKSGRRVVSPNLSPTLSRLSLSRINKLLGTSLGLKDAARFADKAGYGVQRASGDTLHLEIPCYRIDIMHSVDVIEDIAIALDLNKLKPEWPRIWTVGDLSAETIETETLAEIMVGLGFQEILTCVLTSPDVVAGKMQMGSENLVTLLNPKMTTHTVMRSWVLPSLLEFLSRNTHVDYPQKIFEVGASISRAENSPLPVREERKVAAVTIHAQAGFTEIRSSLDALMENVGQSFEVKANEHPSFLSGRCGAVISTGREIGIVGEVNPIVLRAWGLNLPAAAFEVNVSQKTPGV